MIESCIISFFVVNSLIEIYLSLRNIVALYKKRPDVAKLVSTDEEYKKMQSYNRDKLILHIFKIIITVVKEIIIVRFRLNQVLYKKFFEGKHFSQVLFFLATYNLNTLFNIPLSAISTFCVEQKHGFNKMTVGLFFKDILKSAAILNVLFFLVLNVVLKLISTYLDSFWFLVWLFIAFVQILMIVVFPVYIQPLFNTFSELEEGPLKETIGNLCNKIGFKASKILVMDGSTRSSHSNAYFVGLAKEKRIVLYDTLKNQMKEEEIMAILCHEFGHWYQSHTLKLVVFGLCQQLLLFWSTNQLLNNKYFNTTLFYQNEPLIIKLLYVAYFMNIIEIPISLCNHILSRKYEREADVYAVNQGYGKELSEALIKLNKENKGNISSDYLYSILYHSHPTLIERMQLIENEMAKIK